MRRSARFRRTSDQTVTLAPRSGEGHPRGTTWFALATAAVVSCIMLQPAGGQEPSNPPPVMLASLGIESRVPDVSRPRGDPGEALLVRFEQGKDLPETLLRVLMSRSPVDPAWYPSPYQTGPARVLVSGMVNEGAPARGFRDVFLRVVDAPTDLDDHEPVAAVELRGITPAVVSRIDDGVWRLTSDAGGRFRAEAWFPAARGLESASGDGFFVEASGDAEFSCGDACARSGVFRLWKRIYLEMDAMYRAGAAIEREAPAGARRLVVDDVRPFVAARRDRPLPILLMHAPWVGAQPDDALLRNNPDLMTRYEEENLVVAVVRPDRSSRRGTLELARPTTRWFGPEAGEPELRDAVVVPAAGLFQVPSLDEARRVFANAFVEIVALPNPGPRVPHAVFDAGRKGEDLSAFAQKWSDYSWVRAADTLNTVVVVAADHKTGRGRGGAVEMHRSIGTCHSMPAHVSSVFLWQGSVERQTRWDSPGRGIGGKAPALVMGELVVHELAHAFGVDDSQGLDRHTRLNSEGTGVTTMNFPIGPEMGNGVVGLHVAEYLDIRRHRDPLRQ